MRHLRAAILALAVLGAPLAAPVAQAAEPASYTVPATVLARLTAAEVQEVLAQYPGITCWWCYLPNYWTCATFGWCALYYW